MIYLFFLLVRLYIYVAVWAVITCVLALWTVAWCIGRLFVLGIEAGQKRRLAYPPINTPIERYQASRR